jgi:hypothetical protein
MSRPDGLKTVTHDPVVQQVEKKQRRLISRRRAVKSGGCEQKI